MNISDSSLITGSGVGNSIRTAAKGTENISDKAAAKFSTSANSDITQVAQGQQFKGEITGITGDKVTIMLDNDKSLNARMNEAVNLNIGDKLVFQVKENNGNNVVISPVAQGLGSMKDSAIFSILEANNFSPTEKNYNIAESLLNNSMSVDRASMQRVMQQSYKFPDTSIDSIVQLNKLNIPVNESTLSQYNDYMNNTHQLMNDITNMTTSILDMQAEMTNELLSLNTGSGEAMLAINTELLNIISDASDLPVEEAEVINEIPIDNSDVTEGMIASEVEVTDAAEKAADNETGSKVADINGQMSEEIEKSGETPAKDMPKTVDTASSEQSVAETNVNSNDDVQANSIAAKYNLTDDGFEKLKENLRALGLDSNTVEQITESSDSSMKLLNSIAKELGGLSGIESDKLQEFFTSKEYRQVLEQGITDKFTLNPEKMKNPSELDELYKSIYEKTNKLMESFGGKGGSSAENFNQQGKSMGERIDFISNLNNMFTYAQIPVRMNSESLNSELFVYMNKKSVKDNKDDISALLHLDMDHLGPTDVHVSLHAGTVHTRFYVEDEESAKIIDEHMSMLERAINDSGFMLTNEVITREPTINTQENAVVSNMFDTDLEKSVRRYTFDMRR